MFVCLRRCAWCLCYFALRMIVFWVILLLLVRCCGLFILRVNSVVYGVTLVVWLWLFFVVWFMVGD